MRWIDEADLATWSKRADAKALLSKLVADLIRATIADATRFRFPSGDYAQLRGWDGDLETTEQVAFVPHGKSKWEFGVGGGAAKASRDYTKRTKNTELEVAANNTLVLVNLGCWDTPREMLTKWEDKRTRSGPWREVRYLDAVVLLEWLERYPAIAARYAREVLKSAPQEGALSTDEFWDEFSSRFSPRLSEEVVLADRQKIAEGLITDLLGQPKSIVLGGETSEEVLAFAVAAIRSASPDCRRLLESKTLIIRNEAAARHFTSRAGLVFFVMADGEGLSGQLATAGPTLSAATGAQANRHVRLARPTASGMAKGLELMGLEHDEAYALAHLCGRSLTILRRITPAGAPASPEWLPLVPELKPAFLAGAWSDTSDMDRDILQALLGKQDYGDFERVLLQARTLSDPPLDYVADVWHVRSPVDGFHSYGAQISSTELQRLRAATLKVFSHSVAAISREQRFTLSFGAPADYSSWLRDGLAMTLLIVAAMPEVGGLRIAGRTAQQYVDEIVQALPDWGIHHHSLVRLRGQVGVIAEAAPDAFLSGIESLLRSNPEDLRGIFQDDSQDLFGSTSPHVSILWAIEIVAWDPRYVNRAVLVLAKLAELDPDPRSRHANRPLSSLRSILLAWSPNTYAVLGQRIACLDLVLSISAEVGWQLLVALLPRPHDTSSPTPKPKVRDVEPKQRELLTVEVLRQFTSVVVNRAIKAAIRDESRIVALIKMMSGFPPESRAELLSSIDSHLVSAQVPEGCSVWHELKLEVARHDFFSDADWALPETDRAEIHAMLSKHMPSDEIASERHLFDDATPLVGKYIPEEEPSVDPEVARHSILDKALIREGVSGVFRLAKVVKYPNLIPPALRGTSISLEQVGQLFEMALATEALKEFAHLVSMVGVEMDRVQWEVTFTKSLKGTKGDSEIARLLQGWPLDSRTWLFVGSFGQGVEDEYWRQLRGLPIRASLDVLLHAIDQLRRRKRSLDVITLIYDRLKDLSTELVKSLLAEGHQYADSAFENNGNQLLYHVTSTFKALRGRSDISEQEIASLEYAYLPMLQERDDSLTIVSLLSRDPKLFVEVLSHVFKGDSSETDEAPTDEMRSRATNSYQLLSQFRTTPGIVGKRIDFETLRAWIAGARELALHRGLSDIADIYIGNMLAHSPMDPDEAYWPPSAVCQAIELVESDKMESGIRTESFNKRGAHWRGIHDGGSQERSLAATYDGWADQTLRYPRSSALLTDIADMWREHAETQDVRAEKRKLKR